MRRFVRGVPGAGPVLDEHMRDNHDEMLPHLMPSAGLPGRRTLADLAAEEVRYTAG